MTAKHVSTIDHLRDTFFEALPRYRYVETLGHGGMGIVFHVEDLELGEDIAIKILLSSFFESESEDEFVARFKRETNLNRRIKHANVARIHDFGVVGGIRYLTMEYVPGKNLAKLIEERGPLAPDFVVPVLRQVALGTGAAHRLGIIHRDLKSQNIMVDDEGGVALLDFGTARQRLDEALTREGYVVGTVTHMSPEYLEGHAADARSDIYSIGVVAFHALTGHTPFGRGSIGATTLAIMNDPVPAAELQRLPPELTAIVLRCLDRSPAARYASAEELERDLALLMVPRKKETALGPAVIEPAPQIDRATAPVRALPPHAETAERRTVLEPRDTPPGAKKRKPVILIVDDDAGFCDLAAAYLEEDRYETVQANDAEHALELVLERPVDLVVMDVMMPVMDGFDAIRVLRSQARTANLPVILMSTFIERNRLAFAVQAGATNFLAKPIDANALRTGVEKILTHLGFEQGPPPA